MGRPKKEVTQEMRVLKYIEDFGSISPLEAIKDLGVMRLARLFTTSSTTTASKLSQKPKPATTDTESPHIGRDTV